VRPVRIHDLCHTFATTVVASGQVSLRTLQEWMGHRDLKTTQIYADYWPVSVSSSCSTRRLVANLVARSADTAQLATPETPVDTA
jgi:integrase